MLLLCWRKGKMSKWTECCVYVGERSTARVVNVPNIIDFRKLNITERKARVVVLNIRPTNPTFILLY